MWNLVKIVKFVKNFERGAHDDLSRGGHQKGSKITDISPVFWKFNFNSYDKMVLSLFPSAEANAWKSQVTG